MKPDSITNLLTPDDLALMLKVSKATVYRLVDARQLPFHKVRGSLRFDLRDVVAYLESNRVEPVKM